MAGKKQSKTYLMQLLENRHPGHTIEALMVNAFRKHGSERAAAKALGITQQAFNTWKYRLELQGKIPDTRSVKSSYITIKRSNPKGR